MRLVGWTPDDEQGFGQAVRQHEARLRRRRLLRRARRPLLALLLGVALAASLLVLRPPGVATAAVVTARADLPAGHELAATDLAATRLPTSLVPPSAVAEGERDRLLGGVLTAPLGRGELVTTLRTLGPGLLHGAPRGTLAVPVPLAQTLPDGAVRAGDTVAVIVAAPPGRAADPALGDPAAGHLGPGGPGLGEPVLEDPRETPGAPGRPDAGLLVDRAVVLMPPPPVTGGALVSSAGGAPVAVLALSATQAQAVADAGAEQPLVLGVVAAP